MMTDVTFLNRARRGINIQRELCRVAGEKKAPRDDVTITGRLLRGNSMDDRYETIEEL